MCFSSFDDHSSTCRAFSIMMRSGGGTSHIAATVSIAAARPSTLSPRASASAASQRIAGDFDVSVAARISRGTALGGGVSSPPNCRTNVSTTAGSASAMAISLSLAGVDRSRCRANSPARNTVSSASAATRTSSNTAAIFFDSAHSSG